MSLEKWTIEIATKWVEKLTENTSTKDIIKHIEHFRQSENGKKINEKFNKLSEKDKMSLYKNWWLNIWKMSIGMWGLGHIQSLFIYESKTLKTLAPEVSILYRFLIHMGAIDIPSWLTQEELVKNVKKDAKFYNATITAAQIWCMVFAPEVEPLLRALKPAIKTLSQKAVEISQTQHGQKETFDEKIKLIQQNTIDDVQKSLQDIQKKVA